MWKNHIKCKYSFATLEAFVSRADSLSKVGIAFDFLANLKGLSATQYESLTDHLYQIKWALEKEASA